MAVTAKIWASALFFVLSFFPNECHVTRFGKSADSLFFPPLSASEKLGHKVKIIEAKVGDDVDEFLRRFPRSVTPPPSPALDFPLATELNDTHTTLIVHWAGVNSDVIIALGRSSLRGSSPTNVYVSFDYGKTFQDISYKMKVNTSTRAQIARYYNTPAHNSHYIFTDIEHNCTFTTVDFTTTIQTYCTMPFRPRTIAINAVNPNLVLGMDEESEEKELFISDDFGFTWRKIQGNVKSFFWGVAGYDNVSKIYVEEERSADSGNIVYSSDNLFRGWGKDVVINGVIDFEVRGRYLFATKKVRLLGGSHTHTQLWVSSDRKPFENAEFPTPENQEYYIADASEDQVMVCVNHNKITTNLYISEVKGLRFSLSLSNVVYFNPKGANKDTWLRYYTNDTFADIHRVDGMRGIFIASQLTGNTFDIDKQRSLITFDKGGEWQLITAPPEGDREANCSGKLSPWSSTKMTNCTLHLTQQLHRLYPGSRASPILSRKSAPGLIIASGVIGTNIKMNPNVFVSSDAGVSWSQILHGEYMYTFADHGGIIIASKQFEETDSIFFSVDYGQIWHKKKISQENIRIYGILTEPGEATTIFSIFGSKLSHHSWRISQLDMVKELKKKCTAEDYKLWSFSLKNSTKSCLLGRHTVYERRIRDAVCYNGEDYVRQIRSVQCPCTRLDYECDFGFVQKDNYDCVQDMSMNATLIHQAPYPCPPNTYYPYSRGYRKVAGDTCSGGDEHRFAPLMYSCPIEERREFVVFSTRTKITRIDLDTKQQEDLVTEGLDAVTALDFDYRNNCLYWADITLDRISRLCLQGNRTNVEPVIVENLQTVEALALDWTSNNLYWIDSESKGIYVSLTTGQYRRTLFQGDAYLDRPRGLALDPHHGYMYWSDWSISAPRINRAWMDGTNTSIETIVNKTYVRWPNGLAIDLPSEKIYWTDAGLHKIMTADLDGRNIQTLVFGISAVPHPYSIGVFKNNIYWTDWGRSAVMTASKSGYGLTNFSSETLEDIVDMKVVSHSSQQAKSACTPASCSQLCLPRPPPSDHKKSHNRTCKCGDKVSHSLLPSGDEQCMCEQGQRVVNKTCVNNPMNSTTCAADKFQCGNSRCIPFTWKCDNENDCGDRSDEIDCPLTTCPDTSFTCDNSKCVPLRWKCDYDNDCGDSSDEQNCRYPTCNAQQFACANGRCINANWHCDNDNDCHDGSDERNCSITTSSPAQGCQPWEYRCPGGGCISQQAVCNGYNDCFNGSDEAHCNVTTCPSWRHMCASGNQCIFATWVCDGEPDCTDGSDEVNCATTTLAPTTPRTPSVCHQWQFTCRNQMCVFHASRCDGYNDCGDDSDEENCGEEPLYSTSPPPQCRSGQWQCKSDMSCVSHFDRCNGIPDCSDGTDEDNCDVTCDQRHFECYNAGRDHQRRCIWDSWVCDGERDCFSGEDELNCNSTCGPSEFSCEETQGCVPLIHRCNGINDCVDSSDEWGCGTQPSFPVSTTTAPRKQCDKNQFLCPMENRCILWFNVCDKKIDCQDDHADELVPNCRTDHGHFVDTSAEVNSNNITVIWHKQFQDVGLKNCSYIVSKLTDGDNSSWKNFSVNAMSYTLLNLTPLTKYHVAVYVNCRGEVSPHSRALKLTTSAPVPKAPRNLNVHKKKDSARKVIVEWTAPTTHRDIIDHYTIYYQDMNNTYYPLFSQRVLTNGKSTKTFSYPLSEIQLTVNHTYKFWVTASNSQGEGPKSKTITYKFTTRPVEQIGQVTIKSNTNPNRFVLSWGAVKGAKRYISKMTMRLTSERDELTTIISSTKPTVTFDKICPGHSYDFEITPVFSFGHGSHSRVQHTAFTHGSRVDEPKSVTVNKTGAREATVSVNLKEANESHIIYYYERELDLQDFLKKAKRVNMTGSSKVIHGLKSCEVYYFRVAAVQDGCPVTYPKHIETDPDSTAPPKLDKVQVESSSESIWANVTWRAPCDYEVTPLEYSIEKTEINSSGSKIHVEHISLGKATKNISLWHKLPNLKRGATYQIRVRTNLKGSEFSEPKNITIAPYGAPADPVAQDVGNGFVYLFWSPAPKDRPTIKGNNTMLYRLDITIPDKPGFIITKLTNKTQVYLKLETERLFQAKIRYNKIDGFYGDPATIEFILNNGTSIAAPTSGVISTTNLVTILVPIGVIVLILGVVLSIYVIRHRRLQRSFMAFANSHYDPRSGTTRFTAADDLGDDDDAPLIQGFSDDVPLVIA